MRYAMEDRGDEMFVSLNGDLTFRHEHVMGKVIDQLEEPWVRTLVLDMGDVTAVDHAGLSMLTRCASMARGRSINMRLNKVRADVLARLGPDLEAACCPA